MIAGHTGRTGIGPYLLSMRIQTKILLVEDEVSHALMIQRAFEDHSTYLEVTHQSNLADTRLSLKEIEFDLVISDLKLPDGLGTDLVREVDDVPVIIMTSHGDERKAVSAIKSGAWDYIVKSDYNFREMPHVAERAIREWRLTVENKLSLEREKELQRRLGQAERLQTVGRLAGGVAHDLNNILTPILSLPDLIMVDVDLVFKGDKNALARTQDGLDGIIRSATKAATVIQDLLTLSRQRKYELQSVDLNKIVNSFLNSAELAQMKSVTIRQNLADSPLLFAASVSHIERVLLNLVVNAKDAMGGQGEISVETKSIVFDERHFATLDEIPKGEYVQLKVRDNGSGINDEDMNRIFEPFFSTKDETAHSGTGLGLAIVWGIIKEHDGFADIETSLEGASSGTCFTLYFPRYSTP